MSMLAGTIADRLTQHIVAADAGMRKRPSVYLARVDRQMSLYGTEWAHTDIPDLLREARRLADDYWHRTGLHRHSDEWDAIDARIADAASSTDSLRDYGIHHAEADVVRLVRDIDQLEQDLAGIAPRM
jgi:hypothetical protein